MSDKSNGPNEIDWAKEPIRPMGTLVREGSKVIWHLYKRKDGSMFKAKWNPRMLKDGNPIDVFANYYCIYNKQG